MYTHHRLCQLCAKSTSNISCRMMNNAPPTIPIYIQPKTHTRGLWQSMKLLLIKPRNQNLCQQSVRNHIIQFTQQTYKDMPSHRLHILPLEHYNSEKYFDSIRTNESKPGLWNNRLHIESNLELDSHPVILLPLGLTLENMATLFSESRMLQNFLASLGKDLQSLRAF